MHDIRFIRENPEAFDAILKRRNLLPASKDILDLDAARRAIQTEAQALQAKRNDLSKQIGEVKRTGGNADALMQDVAANKDKIAAFDEQEKALGVKLNDILSSLPNAPADDVPDGKDEHDNKELRRTGEPPRINSAKQHFEIGENLKLMDFENAAKLSGARFTILKGALARLERALGNFMLDVHTEEFGYTEISPPLMVKDEIMYGTAQLPKFAEDQFKTTHGLWLIPTAEVPLTNIVNSAIVEREKLPLRFVARTPCFRAEAGAAGRDTRGMIRQHQFYKVEMVSITAPDQSDAEHERMTQCAETILTRLGLAFRTIVLCTGDMGFGARKTYDIEVWLPGQNAYREISSCSTCGDFQARRMNARCRAAGEKNTEFVHTLNGSGLAIGRTLIAVLENYQQPDGSVIIPPVLRPYMGGLEKIEVSA
jgi:seryl-tRNA synthetase